MAAGGARFSLTRRVIPLLGRGDPIHHPLRHEGTQGRRLERFVEHLDHEGARGLAHSRGAIGGYEHSRNF